MSRTSKLTDMGWHEEDALWKYTHLSEPLLSSELARLSYATIIGDTHCVTFQPCPEPDLSNQDRFVVQDWPLSDGTWSFRAVFDGHAGHDTADHVARTLPGIVKHKLAALLAHHNHTQSDIGLVLSESISEFDNNITNDLLQLFPDINYINKLSDTQIRDIINDEGTNAAIVKRCMRGSTVLVSLTDPQKYNLWVASLGDCQAILGVKSADGHWKSSVLSSYHNGENKEEVQRIQKEHPGESQSVLNDRVLGAIAVTRAVGDHLFKLPSVYTHRVFMNSRPGFSFSTKVEDFLNRNMTPPYLSNHADVRHIDLRAAAATEARLIMCSDGLLDLYDHRGEGPDMVSLGATWVDVLTKSEGSQNLALSLLRAGLGGEDEERVSRMITVEMSFRWMDDTTVLVQRL
ncbi:protein serine threonine phosphatase 2C [Crucibulum laeve]|uniref:Protein serine threonine phosphatase 2C n=1 Tax=Crucibulum laeve TaxID=68775 RepID=A0A5C3MI54_9AGAR|nr:protein serine threonine phosphatase 2C [Crucibulum laeve]